MGSIEPFLISQKFYVYLVKSVFICILQAERYVDRKIDQAEGVLKKNQKKAINWYATLLGDDSGPKINNFHIFLFGFTGGAAIGLACA